MREQLLRCLALGFRTKEVTRASVTLFPEVGQAELTLSVDGMPPQRRDELLEAAKRIPDVTGSWAASARAITLVVQGQAVANAHLHQLTVDLDEASYEQLGVTLAMDVRAGAPRTRSATVDRDQPRRYSGEDIYVLEPRDAMRARPSLFAGPDESPRSLLGLLLDEPLQEVRARRATLIRVSVNDGGRVTVADNGMPFSLELMPDSSTRWVDAGMRGPSADSRQRNGHAVNGLLIVRALSISFTIRSWGPGGSWRRRWRLGRAEGDVEPIRDSEGAGAEVSFLADPTLFSVALTQAAVREEVERLACFTPSAAFEVNGARIQYDSLETAARGIAAATALWSEKLFVFSFEDDSFTAHFAFGLTDSANGALRVLVDGVPAPLDLNATSVLRALGTVVSTPLETLSPSHRQLAGCISFERTLVPDTQDHETMSQRTFERLVEPLSVYLDSVPLARERLGELWRRT